MALVAPCAVVNMAVKLLADSLSPWERGAASLRGGLLSGTLLLAGRREGLDPTRPREFVRAPAVC